jgi:hypothetical protein
LKRKLSIVILTAGLLLLGTNPGNSTIGEDEQWPIPNEFGLGHHSIVIEDPVTGLTHSQLTGYADRNTFLCKSLDDPRCETVNNFNYDIILPICTEDTSMDCIRKIEAIHGDGRIDTATFKRYTHLDHPNAFRGSKERGLPDPLMPSLWEFQNSRHAFGNQYAIAVGMSGNIGKGQQVGNHRDFFINLHPVSLKVGSGGTYDVNSFANYSKCLEVVDPSTGQSHVGCGGGAEDFGNYRCAFKLGENGNCLLRHAFPEGVKFRVTVDLSKEPNGWFHGRMKDPEIKVEPIGVGGVRLIVEGMSTKQPVFYWGDNFSSMTEVQRQIWNECVPRFGCFSSTRIAGSNPDRESDGNKRNVQFYPRPTGESLIDFMAKFLPVVGDKSVVVPSAWNMRALSTSEMSKAARCFTQGGGVKGIVTTNATVYSEGPPSFEGTTLQYRVAAPHYTAQGEKFRGTYNLVMRSEVARCLYGFSDAPIKASIEVFGEDGEKSVATTIVGERSGWLYLAAHNFTFSSPTIKATISQDVAVSSPTPIPTPTRSSDSSMKTPSVVVSPEKKSIKCFKGNKTKKVTAVKPKCPKGFKKA